MSDTPRIYIASLSDYNAGRLHGAWFDVLDYSDADELYAAFKERVLDTSKEMVAEEWAIHDYEGFCGLTLSEYESFDNVIGLAQAIEEHGEPFALWLSNDSTYTYEDVETFEEQYAGEWDSLEDWAENFMEDTGQLESIPENLRIYFDFEKFANDARIGGDVWTATDSNYSTHVFWNH